MMNGKEKRALRARAHHLKPVVSVGAAGLTRAVLDEIDSALEHHELIKLKIAGEDKNGRMALAGRACAETSADLIQVIGGIVVLYRKSQEPGTPGEG